MTNTIKIFGCCLVFIGVHPLLAYSIVGFGAAAYSPAKYGILTELLPAEKLVIANGWMEGLTVLSIISGTVLGGALINPTVSGLLLTYVFPFYSSTSVAALTVVVIMYALAAIFNLRIPDTGARYKKQPKHPIELFKGFYVSFRTLWADKLGQISLAVTTLFWGAGATLQFIVLKWASDVLNLTLDKAAFLQGVFAVGITIGSILAARYVPLKKALSTMWLALVMGFVVICLTQITTIWLAYPVLIIIGALAGFFIVPMNALLQHRGYVLLSAGHSIAVQNFNENLSILGMLTMYSLLVWMDVSIHAIIVMFGLFVTGIMFCIIRWHAYNQKIKDSTYLIGEAKRH